jgi:nicotinamidase-related amidase
MQKNKKLRFSLTSELSELLVEFEECSSLADLAKRVYRDVSVVSRAMQEIAPYGLVEKKDSRWVLTLKGRQFNTATRAAIAAQARILEGRPSSCVVPSEMPTVDSATALLILGFQNGFDDAQWGMRNNSSAEENILVLLSLWREREGIVVHVRHGSKDPRSPLREGTHGYSYKPGASPAKNEIEFVKSANCAFINTELEKELRSRNISKLVIAGFSANHCVDATARVAGDLEFLVTVISDACVSFDRLATDGTLIRAEAIHRVIMANLNQEFALVTELSTLLESMEGTLL